MIYTIEFHSNVVTGWATPEDAAEAVRDGEWYIAPSRFLSEIEDYHREGLGRPLSRPEGAVRFRQRFPDWMPDGRMDNRTRTLHPVDNEHWTLTDGQRAFDLAAQAARARASVA